MEKKFSILLVDDEPDFLNPIASWLEGKGYEVRLAPDGKECIAFIEQALPDIVFLDVNMPVMNGIDTLKHIRQHYDNLPVIMITAESDKLPMLDEMGISGFFPKGGTIEQIEQLLEPLIRIHAKMKPSA